MKTISLKIAPRIIAFAMFLTFGSTAFAQAVTNVLPFVESDSIPNPKECDASFWPLVLSTMDYPSSHSEVVGYNATNKTYKFYYWNFGDGTTDTGRYVQHYFKEEGIYQVSLTVVDTDCKNTQFIWITKRGEILGNKDRCTISLNNKIENRNVSFQDLHQIMTLVADGNFEEWNWDFGDGNSKNGAFVTHTYAKAGLYTATLTKKSYHNPCYTNPACDSKPILVCSNTETFKVNITDTNPYSCKSDIAYSTNDNTLTIKDNAFYISIYGRPIDHIKENRVWDFGDGHFAYGQEASYTYAKPGKYKVKLTKQLIFDPCPFVHDTLPRCMAVGMVVCTDTSFVEINIGNEKKCKSDFEVEVANNKVIVKTTSTADFVGYTKLDFGDGDFIEIEGKNMKASHTFAKAGNYPICLYIATVPDSILPYVKLSSYCNDLVCKTVSIATSSEEPDKGTIASIYPNPADENMTIYVQNSFENLTLRIFDQTGKLKKEVKEITTGTQQIDTKGLENGLYFYTFSEGQKVVNKGKITISK
jgi:PKD repeat protein